MVAPHPRWPGETSDPLRHIHQRLNAFRASKGGAIIYIQDWFPTAPAGRVSLKRTSPTGTCWWNRVLAVPERLQNKLLLSSLTL